MTTMTTPIKTTFALLIVAAALLLSVAVASAGTVTSERVVFGQPYGTVRLDEGRDYLLVDGVFVPRKSFDALCQDAINPFRRYDYTTAASGPFQLSNGHYYIVCTN